MSSSGPEASAGHRVGDSTRTAQIALLGVSAAWGLTFPMIGLAVLDAPPFAFLALRFPAAFVLLFPLFRFRLPAGSSILPGVGLGFLLGASYYTQTLGLLSTTPTRSAFITALSVLLVPLIYPVFTRRRPSRGPVAGALVAALGLYWITDPGSQAMNRGDMITLGCALAYSLYMIVLEGATRRHDYRDLLVVQSAFLALIFIPPALVEFAPVRWGAGLVWGLLTTGPVLAVTLYLQNRFQKCTTATRAAVIFASEPLFAAMFSFLILGETLGRGQWAGGALIVVGIGLAIHSRSPG